MKSEKFFNLSLPWPLVFRVRNGWGCPFTIFLIVPVLRLQECISAYKSAFYQCPISPKLAEPGLRANLFRIRVRNLLGNIIVPLKKQKKLSESNFKGLKN